MGFWIMDQIHTKLHWIKAMGRAQLVQSYTKGGLLGQAFWEDKLINISLKSYLSK